LESKLILVTWRCLWAKSFGKKNYSPSFPLSGREALLLFRWDFKFFLVSISRFMLVSNCPCLVEIDFQRLMRFSWDFWVRVLWLCSWGKNLKNLVLIGFCSIGIIHECWISMFKLSGVDSHGWIYVFTKFWLRVWRNFLKRS
jgi:hypothetical protein